MKFASSKHWREPPETESTPSNPTTYDGVRSLLVKPVVLSRTDLAQGYLDLKPDGRKDLLAYWGFTRAD